eukprot:TRINITY_DN13427_c0_g2_i1.p1 TRINITY_DN13427_c0_g2~~TRINITY_DN13427_c0_g2_i1.p1  ORF type:complete len:658 (+),score=154.50 TRINITY_DN13427_c0_g2_i1:109-2082(+)
MGRPCGRRPKPPAWPLLLRLAAAQTTTVRYGDICVDITSGTYGYTTDGCAVANPPGGPCTELPRCEKTLSPPQCTVGRLLPDGTACPQGATDFLEGSWVVRGGGETSPGACQGGICRATAGCNDGAQNGDEQDVDCGGSCPACPPELGPLAFALSPELKDAIAFPTPAPTQRTESADGGPSAGESVITYVAVALALALAAAGIITLVLLRGRIRQYCTCLQQEENLLEKRKAEESSRARKKQSVGAAADNSRSLREYFNLIGAYADTQLQVLQNTPAEIRPEDAPAFQKYKVQAILTLNQQLEPAVVRAFQRHDVDGSGFLDPKESELFFDNYTQECFISGRPLLAYVLEQMFDELYNTAVEPRGHSAARQWEDLVRKRQHLTQHADQLAADNVARIQQDYRKNKAVRDAAAFAVLDTSGDGRLVQEEVVAGLLRGTELNMRLETVFYQSARILTELKDASAQPPPPIQHRRSIAAPHPHAPRGTPPDSGLGPAGHEHAPVAAADHRKHRRQTHTWNDVGGQGTMAANVAAKYSTAAAPAAEQDEGSGDDRAHRVQQERARLEARLSEEAPRQRSPSRAHVVPDTMPPPQGTRRASRRVDDDWAHAPRVVAEARQRASIAAPAPGAFGGPPRPEDRRRSSAAPGARRPSERRGQSPP